MGKQLKIFNFTTLQLALVAVLLVGLQTSASAQEDISDIIGAEAQRKVSDRIKFGLQLEKDQREQIGRKAGEIIEKEGRSRSITIGDRTYQNMPAKHPLLDNDGADSQQKSKKEYAEKDTATIFHDETFAQCLEDRQVFNGDYLGACSKACPGPFVKVEPGCRVCDPLREPDCLPNHYYVSELYFPVYQTRTYPGRAMGSFDTNGNYLSGEDRRADLKLGATKQRINSTGKQLAEGIVREMIGQDPKSISDKLYPDWYEPSVEWFGHDGDQSFDPMDPYSFHSLTYQTNAHRQATRRRPKLGHLGYQLEKSCFFHTLDNPVKDVISAASYGDKEEQLKAAMWAKETEKIDPQGAKASVLSKGPKISDLKSLKANGGALPQELQGLSPSQRMQEWSWMRQGLERIGVRPRGLERDYTFYGHELTAYDSYRHNAFVDPFYAAVSSNFSHYMLSANPQFAANTPLRRALQFSYYMARGSKPNYSGEDPVLKENILFTDKMQIIFPPWKDGEVRRGSHCFRPESIARLEPGRGEGDLARTARATDSGHFSLPIEIRKRFVEKGNLEEGLPYANEVRIAYYVKRVNCYCTLCGVPSGCSVLNDGDHKEESFYGTTPLAGSSPVLFVGGSTAPVGPTSRSATVASSVVKKGENAMIRRSRKAQKARASMSAF